MPVPVSRWSTPSQNHSAMLSPGCWRAIIQTVFLPGPGWPTVTQVRSRPSTVLPRCDSRASGERWHVASSDRWRSSGYGSK
ncbi:hypothetical protein D3C87_1110220 [compost metagenome]